MKIEKIHSGWFYPNLYKEADRIKYINPATNPPILKSLHHINYRRIFIHDDDRLNPKIYVMTSEKILRYTKENLTCSDYSQEFIKLSQYTKDSPQGDLIYETLDAIPIIENDTDVFQGRFLLITRFPNRDKLQLALKGSWHDDEYFDSEIVNRLGTATFSVNNSNLELYFYGEEGNTLMMIPNKTKRYEINIKKTIKLLDRMKIYE